MGEIADMMAEGDLCAGCGVFIDEHAAGFPRYCSGCKGELKLTPERPYPDDGGNRAQRRRNKQRKP